MIAPPQLGLRGRPLRRFRVRMHETVIVEYEIDAEDAEQAREWMGVGLRPVSRTELETPDWDVEAVEAVEAVEDKGPAGS